MGHLARLQEVDFDGDQHAAHDYPNYSQFLALVFGGAVAVFVSEDGLIFAAPPIRRAGPLTPSEAHWNEIARQWGAGESVLWCIVPISLGRKERGRAIPPQGLGRASTFAPATGDTLYYAELRGKHRLVKNIKRTPDVFARLGSVSLSYTTTLGSGGQSGMISAALIRMG